MKIEIELSPDQVQALIVGKAGGFCRRYRCPALTEGQATELVSAMVAAMIDAPQMVFDAVAARVFRQVAQDPWEANAEAVREEQLHELAPRLAVAQAVLDMVEADRVAKKGGRA